MRRLGLALLGLGLFALAEIALVSWVASVVGVGWTLGLLALGVVAGWLAWRVEGVRVWEALREARDPAQQGKRVTDGLLVLLGGLLLMAPGFLTDALGLVFVLPWTRPAVRKGVQRAVDAWLRPYRAQADLLEARLRPDTVVPGQVVPDRTSRPNDNTVIRGEIVG